MYVSIYIEKTQIILNKDNQSAVKYQWSSTQGQTCKKVPNSIPGDLVAKKCISVLLAKKLLY